MSSPSEAQTFLCKFRLAPAHYALPHLTYHHEAQPHLICTLVYYDNFRNNAAKKIFLSNKSSRNSVLEHMLHKLNISVIKTTLKNLFIFIKGHC